MHGGERDGEAGSISRFPLADGAGDRIHPEPSSGHPALAKRCGGAATESIDGGWWRAAHAAGSASAQRTEAGGRDAAAALPGDEEVPTRKQASGDIPSTRAVAGDAGCCRSDHSHFAAVQSGWLDPHAGEYGQSGRAARYERADMRSVGVTCCHHTPYARSYARGQDENLGAEVVRKYLRWIGMYNPVTEAAYQERRVAHEQACSH